MLKIYGADLSSPANKVRFTANLLNLDYEYIRVKVRDGENRTEEFLKRNPVGKIPVIDDDGFCLFESEAIVKYLAVKCNSDLYPQDLQQRAVIDQWMEFANFHVGSAMGRVLFNRIFVHFLKIPVDENSLNDGLKFLNRFLPIINKQLSKNRYFAGSFLSLADITLLSVLDGCEVGKIDLSPFENIVTWRNKLKLQKFYTDCYKTYGENLEKLKR